MQMSLNKGETAVHGCQCPGDMAVRMREVLARPWVGVCVPLALSLSLLILTRFLRNWYNLRYNYSLRSYV